LRGSGGADYVGKGKKNTQVGTGGGEKGKSVAKEPDTRGVVRLLRKQELVQRGKKRELDKCFPKKGKMD